MRHVKRVPQCQLAVLIADCLISAQCFNKSAQYFCKCALYFYKRALYFCKSALHFCKRALCFLKSAMYFRQNVPQHQLAAQIAALSLSDAALHPSRAVVYI